MAKKKSKPGHCCFCGRYGKLTKDHIPPKCFFPPDNRSNLITVPACSECNTGSSKDDELLRDLFVSVRESSEHPSAQAVLDTVKRSWQPRERDGLIQWTGNFRYIAERITPVARKGTNGVIEEMGVISVEQKRVSDFVKKTFHAIYFIQSKKHFPLEWEFFKYH